MDFPWPSMQAHIQRYRDSAGADGHRLGDALQFLLLDSVGARTGQTRTVALLYRAWRGGFVVVASKGGRPDNPGWFHNLRQHPEVRLQVGAWQCNAVACELQGEAYAQVWALMAAIFPSFDTYRATVTRHIPILWLRPIGRNLPEDPASLVPGVALESTTVILRVRHIVQGAAATRDWAPLHHDSPWVHANTQLKDIILNTPSQTGWIHRYLTDRLGPLTRVTRLRQRMRTPLLAGDQVAIHGQVSRRHEDPVGITWLELSLTIACKRTDGDTIATEASAVAALPETSSPWATADLQEPAQWLMP